MDYLPEGSLLHTPENVRATSDLDGLALAMQRRTVLEGVVLKCDSEHNLLVSLGSGVGVIPRREAALGLPEGSVKEIAILSRVGKPVSFLVNGLEADNGHLTPILSRRAAQIQVWNHIQTLAPGTVLAARVTRLERFGAFVDIGCGLTSMIPIDRISVSRIPHPSYRFRPGQNILAVYCGTEPETGHILLSHRELLGTWAENVSAFSAGETVTGIVRGIQPYGIFVELTPNLTGLADSVEGVSENQRVSVFIRAILPQRRKIKLSIIDVMEECSIYTPASYFPLRSSYAGWDYEQV